MFVIVPGVSEDSTSDSPVGGDMNFFFRFSFDPLERFVPLGFSGIEGSCIGKGAVLLDVIEGFGLVGGTDISDKSAELDGAGV
mmetsp:Transcript_10345/g.18595  ORF Transcript_10345/g.18595 Transcript_10345/m.18595 type:complete len:83 (-) Transcript_10345:227-475(-)